MSLDDLIADAPFSYRASSNGLVQIAYQGKTVTTFRGREAARFLARVESADERTAQLAMAKATGNFKRGNERAGKNSRSR
jgi:hypothetical protein